ncbi:MarR family winged helix-turn-helix transcriptional regulator [Jannaschia aquimarina]|uniref:MarR family protein n=1 Tax=Jannaschia aquimarina TaxID=935700 RepID=A0A0D1D2X0_9RHOB|nr:MarR family winged helix-turn-helix transcriptional regulator [Jannaschia aquimarina]KIT14448.1 MarR family protein [Jannaschia aquimarina]SNT29240.1 transcriptional regulator, MarR family [Jannaschia aquimarina]
MFDDDTALAFSVFTEIGILNQLSRTRFEADLPDGVLLPHFSVLNHLVRVSDGRTPLEMARAFQIPKTTMSHNVAVLERQGWVELRPNPDDGRSKRVWITPAGRAFRDKAIERATEAFRPVLEALPPGTLQALMPNLVILREVLDRARDGDPPPPDIHSP